MFRRRLESPLAFIYAWLAIVAILFNRVFYATLEGWSRALT